MPISTKYPEVVIKLLGALPGVQVDPTNQIDRSFGQREIKDKKKKDKKKER